MVNEFYAPFVEGDNFIFLYGFGCINLEIYIIFYGGNVVMKELRPKVRTFDDFLGSGHSTDIATTSASMKIIKNLLILKMGEEKNEELCSLPISIVKKQDHKAIK